VHRARQIDDRCKRLALVALPLFGLLGCIFALFPLRGSTRCFSAWSSARRCSACSLRRFFSTSWMTASTMRFNVAQSMPYFAAWVSVET
jgi:hypothetical protein